METVSHALIRITGEVGTIKSTEELEAYIKELPASLQSNGLLINLFRKRRQTLK